MANVDIQLGYKDSAWFTANATLVLLAGQSVHLLQTGTYKIGDGLTQLSNLLFLGGTATSTDLIIATVVNKTGVNLTAANYQAVRVSTAQGQRLGVELAQANNDNNSVDTIGLVAENININQEGIISILGQLTEINTTGSLQSETWADGDELYLSTSVAGRITNIKPTALIGHIVMIGYVEYAHAIHGKIYVKIANGWELDELHNVYVNPTTLANNDVLVYESTSQLWKNSQESAKVIFKDFTNSSPLTGTTAITLLKSALIPANTVTIDDEINIYFRALRSTISGTANHFFYINTTANLTGATLLATHSGAASYFGTNRNLFIKSATVTETITASFNSGNDNATSSTAAISSLNIDWTANVYIIQAFQNAAGGDSTTSRGITIKRFR